MLCLYGDICKEVISRCVNRSVLYIYIQSGLSFIIFKVYIYNNYSQNAWDILHHKIKTGAGACFTKVHTNDF